MIVDQIDTFCTHVEFRRRLGRGVLVVKVYLHLTSPRVTFYVEDWNELGAIQPASLFLDEITGFVSEARRRLLSNPKVGQERGGPSPLTGLSLPPLEDVPPPNPLP